MKVPLFDSTIQYQALRGEIRAEVEEVMDSQQFILGPKVAAFEKAICDYTGAPFAIGVSSGTDALLAILMAMEIGSGDAVLTTPYSFFATAGGIARVGATPIFIDIEPDTFNISCDLLAAYLEQCGRDENGNLLSHAGQMIRAIVPVHLFGLNCEMNRVLELAGRYQLPVIEDAAQTLGALYFPTDGKPAMSGTLGDCGYYSFYPAKNLGAFGDAGMIVCRDEKLAAKILSVRNHGMEPRYYHHRIGGNFRIDALQAAVLKIKLTHLDSWCAARYANAQFYREEFTRAGLLPTLSLPTEPYAERATDRHHIYHQYIIRAPRRDELAQHLEEHGIGHAIYYPVPLHLQECFASLGYQPGDFPESERAALETLALPIFPELTRKQQQRVVKVIAAFYH